MEKEIFLMDKKEYKNLYIKTKGRKNYENMCKEKRVLNGFNTGTRDIKSNRDYNRRKYKTIKPEDYE